MRIVLENMSRNRSGIRAGASMRIQVPRADCDITVALGGYLDKQMYELMTSLACAILDNTKKWIGVKTLYPKPGIDHLPWHPCSVVFARVSNMKGENYILFCEAAIAVLETYVRELRGGGFPRVEINGWTMDQGNYYAAHSEKYPPLEGTELPRVIIRLTTHDGRVITNSFPRGYTPSEEAFPASK